jgi:mannan endo-1,4-beta-mannosidase
MGTNFWYGANLGSSEKNRPRLLRELDKLSKLGVKNLRVMAASEGPDSEPYRMVPAMQVSPGVYNEKVLAGLDFLLAEMGKRNMKAIMVLSNFWNWSGGMGQYLVWAKYASSIPYPPPHPEGSWSKYQRFVAKFYSNPKALELFFNHVKFIINRKNTISNIDYKNDPAIMAWELANEPRGDKNTTDFRKWINDTAKLIKSIDSNHLVTTGSEGDTPFPSAGTSLIDDHKSEYIDYATIHIWVQNWMIYNPQRIQTINRSIEFSKKYIKSQEEKALQIGKPVVLEEFGISRDANSHNPESKTKVRDQFFTAIFSHVNEQTKKSSSPLQGVNFWAWGGEGRPNNINGLWLPGNDFIGDPPHEFQGWYSVYDDDHSTNSVILDFATKINTHK